MDTHEVLHVQRGQQLLRLLSNGRLWWLEVYDVALDESYRHEHRAGTRTSAEPLWDRALEDLIEERLTPRSDANGTWWLIGRGRTT